MKSLTYMSDSGMILQFNQTVPFFIASSDFNSVSASFDELSPIGLDGTKTQGGNYGKKIIPIEGTIVANSPSHLEKLRSHFAMTMNVKVEGSLILTQDSGKKKKIRCRPSSTPSFEPPTGAMQRFSIEFQSDSPYWTDNAQTVVTIGNIIGTWSFPFTPPVQFGYAVSETTVLNDTSIEIPLIIEVMSQSTLISLENRAGNIIQSFEINQVIAENKKMVINGETCDVDIVNLITGEKTNATNRLVAGSDYITLLPGENKIIIHNGIADAMPLSYILYNVPYLAV